MSTFSVKVMWQNGHPASDVGVMVSYIGTLSGFDEKRTDHDGWVTFNNHDSQPGEIWVHGHNFGSHSLSDGKTYSFTI